MNLRYSGLLTGKWHVFNGRRAWEKVIYLVQGPDTRTGFQLKSYITTRRGTLRELSEEGFCFEKGKSVVTGYNVLSRYMKSIQGDTSQECQKVVRFDRVCSDADRNV